MATSFTLRCPSRRGGGGARRGGRAVSWADGGQCSLWKISAPILLGVTTICLGGRFSHGGVLPTPNVATLGPAHGGACEGAVRGTRLMGCFTS